MPDKPEKKPGAAKLPEILDSRWREPGEMFKIQELELKTIADVTNAIKAGGACMSCHHTPGGLQDILNKVWGKQPTAFKELPVLPMAREVKAQPPREMSPFKFAKLVETVLDEHVRPQLATDGGDLEIVDIKDQVVYVGMKGACEDCVGSVRTIKMMVEQALKDHVDERIRVVQVCFVSSVCAWRAPPEEKKIGQAIRGLSSRRSCGGDLSG